MIKNNKFNNIIIFKYQFYDINNYNIINKKNKNIMHLINIFLTII